MLRWYQMLAALAVAVAVAPAALAGKTRNVVLVISDGVRWQEVFSGADPQLLNEENGGIWTKEAELKRDYWADDPRERRKKLFPFLWGTLATHGQLFGSQTQGSRARVTNHQWFSYPGYNEMTSGVDDPRIDKNEFGPNPNVTVFEWLNSLPQFHGKVEVFGTWETFHDIFNEKRSRLPVRAGANLIEAHDLSPRGRLLTELYRTTTRLEGVDPYDSYLHVVLRDHLEHHRPRVLFVGYGDTDNWQHQGRYDAVLEAERNFDSFLADLWRQLQSLPEYRDSTTLIVATDHGRGNAPKDWKEHGVEQPGSDSIWIGVLGPDTAPLGERHQVGEVTQAQIAATIAALLGEDFRSYKHEAAPSLLEALAAPAH